MHQWGEWTEEIASCSDNSGRVACFIGMCLSLEFWCFLYDIGILVLNYARKYEIFAPASGKQMRHLYKYIFELLCADAQAYRLFPYLGV